MIEMTAVVGLVAGFLGLLSFLLFYVREQSRQTRELVDMVSLASSTDDRVFATIKENSKDYLRHIAALEKLALAPEHIENVQAVPTIQDLLDRENEIEQIGEKGIDLNDGNLSKVPFGLAGLNVAYEDSDLPTEIE